MNIIKTPVYFLVVTLLIYGCSNHRDTRFELLTENNTRIDFTNRVEDTVDFNILNYLYFYDGGGVATGDVNGDGLPDIYFTANDMPDRLYMNRDDFQFEDVTRESGVFTDDDGWSTGVAMADVNGDGYLDIYVSRVNYLNKKGPNQLFINNGDGTFSEKADEFGLDFEGYSTQAAFFDYDGDGDLDLFLLNHTMHGENSYGDAETLRAMSDDKAGDRLFRNDDGAFTDVTGESGIYSSQLGYGLGLAVSDITMNGWPDIYVGNDFHEDDYLYINNGDGTFTEALASSVRHTSRSSMGNDIGDINNDGLPEIVSLDMMPFDPEILKRSGGADMKMVADTKRDFGFKPQYARNTLQLNRGQSPDGNPQFSEISFLAGVAATDWSWASLFFDMNNNGYNDLLVTNGIYRRPNDLDYIRSTRSDDTQQSLENIDEEDLSLISQMPGVRIPNMAFENNGDLTFTDKTAGWGFGDQGFSHGAAYADFDRDGALDLVVNNVNMPSGIYRNRTEIDENSRYLTIELKGNPPNTFGIGAKVFIYSGPEVIYREQMPVRGFQSSVEPVLHAGLGSAGSVDSLIVIWPDRSFEVLENIEANRSLELIRDNASGEFDYNRLNETSGNLIFKDQTGESGIEYTHQPGEFDNFRREPLMPYSVSEGTPPVAISDINGDGLDDIFFGGGKWQPGMFFIQNNDGSFERRELSVFGANREAVDTDALFLDANNDNMPDLLVTSGGNEKTGNNSALAVRLYLNTGDGSFEKAEDALPGIYLNSGTASAADYDGDGHTDLFIGGRSVPWNYGVSPRSFLLKNNGDGTFSDVTEEIAPDLGLPGMITSSGWKDLNGDGSPELILAGEWMPVSIFSFEGNRFIDVTGEWGLSKTGGLWQSLRIDDLNGDGHPDITAGNFGLNSRLKASLEEPLILLVNDFDNTGQSAPLIVTGRRGSFYTYDSPDELALQIRSISRGMQSYKEFAISPIDRYIENEKLADAIRKEVTMMESVVFLNNGKGSFERFELPPLAQITPVMGIHSDDYTGNGHTDLLFTGNLYEVKPGYGGQQDAGYGLLLEGNGNGEFNVIDFNKSGFYVEGESRGIRVINSPDENDRLLITRHRDQPLVFTINR